MDSVVLSASITGICCILTAALTFLPRLSMKKIWEEQLLKLYVPLSRLFCFSCKKADEEMVAELRDILYANPHLAPDILVEELKELERGLRNGCVDFKKFKMIWLSNYHWTRKKLRLPYTRYEITKKLLPHTQYQEEHLLTFLWFVPTIICVIGYISYLLE